MSVRDEIPGGSLPEFTLHDTYLFHRWGETLRYPDKAKKVRQADTALPNNDAKSTRNERQRPQPVCISRRTHESFLPANGDRGQCQNYVTERAQ